MWKILGCAVQGNGHIAENIPCQDKVASRTENGTSVIALADGAGSAKLSHFGAKAVTEYICKKLCADFDFMFTDAGDGTKANNQLLCEIKETLNSVAKQHDCVIDDLKSTLLAVAVRGEDVLAVHLGDGVIGCIKDDGISVISSPENGEYANVTVFTTSKEALSSIKLIKGRIKNKKGFVLMSDGSCASLYNKKTNRISEGIRSFIGEGNQDRSKALNEQLIESFKHDIKSRTSDDCSIAILYQDSESFPGYLSFKPSDRKSFIRSDDFGRLYKDSDSILRYISDNKGRSLNKILGWMHKKPARIKMTVNRLENCNLIYGKDGIYMPVIKMVSSEKELVDLDDCNENN